jgi:hypothetical protein
MKLTNNQVFQAIEKEMSRQDAIFGEDKPQSLPGFLLIARKELNEAEEGWLKNKTDAHAPLNELVQVAAVIVQALKRYGCAGCPVSTDDGPVYIWNTCPDSYPPWDTPVLTPSNRLVRWTGLHWIDCDNETLTRVEEWRYLVKEDNYDWNKNVRSAFPDEGAEERKA